MTIMPVVSDKYGRPLEGLRVSVNAECNFNCIFCHMEGIGGADVVLKPREYRVIARAFKELGGKEVKITGGEPLLRNDLPEIVNSFTSLSLKTSLTTNGTLLKRFLEKLVDAGIHHVNVSLHALDPKLFHQLTGGRLERVLESIEEALRLGVRIKLNYVALKANMGEFPRILDYASEWGTDLNVIQLMPLFHVQGGNGSVVRLDLGRWRSLDSSIDHVENLLARLAIRVERASLHSRKIYHMPTGIRVTVIRGYDNPFACYNCTRLRLTPDGKIKTCLYAEHPHVDVYSPAKTGDVKAVKQSILKALLLRRPRFPPRIQISLKHSGVLMGHVNG